MSAERENNKLFAENDLSDFERASHEQFEGGDKESDDLVADGGKAETHSMEFDNGGSVSGNGEL